MLQLNGQKVLITGASGGLGGSLTARFLDAGATVLLHTRDPHRGEALAAQFGCDFVAQDLTAPGAGEQLVRAAHRMIGGLTGVINNAGVQPVKAHQELTEEEWSAVQHLNSTVPFTVTRAAAELLGEGSWITHIASIEGERPATGHAHYAVSKAAVIMHARAAALELGSRGIRVNAVSPGLIERPNLADDWPEGVNSWLSHAPLGRLVGGDDVANACLFLASPYATAITGHNLVVDCGMQTTPGW